VANARNPPFLGEAIARFPNWSTTRLTPAGQLQFAQEIAGTKVASENPIFEQPVDAVNFGFLCDLRFECSGSQLVSLFWDRARHQDGQSIERP
jgi:hypothetical protein